MNPIRFWTLACLLALTALSFAQSPAKQAPLSAGDRLIGAWHLVALTNQSADGQTTRLTNLKGALIYTRDGHMSVEIMYPPSQSNLSNDYVLNGYEASFGSYDVDELARTVTHHVQGSITAGLVGKNLTRAFHFTDRGHLIIHSTRADEHWSVEWAHD